MDRCLGFYNYPFQPEQDCGGGPIKPIPHLNMLLILNVCNNANRSNSSIWSN